MRLLAFLTLASTLLAGWPSPRADYYHANDLPSALKYAFGEAARMRWSVSFVAYTGSMRPALYGGEIVLLEPYKGQEIALGDIVSFYRDADTPRCLHMVAGVNGRAVYMSGLTNRESDGWVARERIHGICRRIITYPR